MTPDDLETTPADFANGNHGGCVHSYTSTMVLGALIAALLAALVLMCLLFWRRRQRELASPISVSIGVNTGMMESSSNQDIICRSRAETSTVTMELQEFHEKESSPEHFGNERNEVEVHSNPLLRNLQSALQKQCHECVLMVIATRDQLENSVELSAMCEPEYVLTRTQALFEQFDTLKRFIHVLLTDDRDENVAKLIPALNSCCVLLCEVIAAGKVVSNTAPSDQTEISDLVRVCSDTLTHAKRLFTTLENPENEVQIRESVTKISEHLKRFDDEIRSLSTSISDANHDAVVRIVDNEMKLADTIISQAAEKLQEILAKSRTENTGVKLEVHENNLDACNALMSAIMELVRKAKDLQEEIVQQNGDVSSPKEFYKQNHQWTEGQLSAAKAVGIGARLLVEAAHRSVTASGEFEELTAASKEIAASVAQLVVSSNVKADGDSKRLAAVSSASKKVTQAVATVLETVKSGQEMLDNTESHNFPHLSLYQAKRIEMESHVRFLKLQQELEKEHKRLAQLRKRDYEHLK